MTDEMNEGILNEYEEVTFINEDGEEETFLHILTFNYESAKYAALVPQDKVDEEIPVVLFMKIIHDSEGDIYVPVDNEVLLEELFEEFASLLDEQEDEEE